MRHPYARRGARAVRLACRSLGRNYLSPVYEIRVSMACPGAGKDSVFEPAIALVMLRHGRDVHPTWVNL